MIAPNRGRRPGAAGTLIEDETAEEREHCPFCEGREEQTPPEVLALGRPTGEDAPGWTVRVVPNLYPAFVRQEVVIHSPRHIRSFAELDDAALAAVAEAWRLRALAGREEGLAYVHAIVNEGRAAGATLLHSHSQLVWLDETPPVVREERPGGVVELLARTDLHVAEHDGVVALVHPAGRAAYELLIAPRAADHDVWAAASLPAALRLLRESIRRLRAVEGPVPWNAWVHAGPRWHVEVVPRPNVFAGIELGAGIYVNPVRPEDAAAALRGAPA